MAYPEFKNVDIGQIMATAQALKASKQQAVTDDLRNQYMGVQMQNATDQNNRANEDQTSQRDAEAAKRNYLVAHAVETSQDPLADLQRFAPEMIKEYEAHAGPGSFPQDPEAIKQLMGNAKQFYGAKAGIQQPSANGAMYKYIGDDGQPHYGTAADVSGKTPYEAPRAPRAPAKAAAASGFNDPRIQELQAAFVTAGYSPPAGFRSKEQQLAMYQGLLHRYDGLSPDDIAHLAASNAIDYKSVGKATQAAASMGGRVEVANNELHGFIPIAKEASAAVDRGSFVPFNRLKQQGQASISDPALKRLFVATQTVLNAYDVLAARGGTDKDKRAENHRILENADSPETYNAALDMITREGEAAGTAARAAMHAEAFGYPAGQPQPPQAAPAQIRNDDDFNRLPHGAEFIAPDGSHRKKP